MRKCVIIALCERRCSILDIVVDVLGWIAKILVGYTTFMGIFCLLPKKKYPVVSPKTKFAILLPARNEENVISVIIKSLQNQDYPDELYDIYVIPNNCTDDTEGAALRAGAKVLHCASPVTTKGEVLHQILDSLKGQYDGYCVFDSDNVVDSQFLARMNDAVCAGAKVAKSRQCALNPYDNWISGSYDLYFQGIHLLHSKARMDFPLSAKLIGTGFMVTDEILEKLGGWNTKTLTEDIEFAVQSALVGEKIWYVPDALTLDEEPISFVVSMRQRRRWSAGVQSVANKYTAKLLFSVPSWMRLDLLTHINMIYAQLLAIVPVVYGALKLPFLTAAATVGYALGGFIVGGILMALFLCVTGKRSPRKQWKAIMLYPIYLASWYPLHFWALFAKPKTWKYIPHGTAKSRQSIEDSVNVK